METEYLKIHQGTTQLQQVAVTERDFSDLAFGAKQVLLDVNHEYGTHHKYEISIFQNGSMINVEINGFIFDSVIKFVKHSYRSYTGHIDCKLHGLNLEKEEFEYNISFPLYEDFFPHLVEAMILISLADAKQDVESLCDAFFSGSFPSSHSLGQRIDLMQSIAKLKAKATKQYDFFISPFKKSMGKLADIVRKDLANLKLDD